MSKTLTPEWKTHLAKGTTTLAYCIKVTLTNGTIYGFTSHSEDIVLSGVTYKSAMGITASALSSGEDMAPGNMEALGFFSATGVLWADVKAGRFNSATHDTYLVNYADLSMPPLEMTSGPLGVITSRGNQYNFELKDWLELLRKNIGYATSPYCRVKRLGNSICGVRVDPPVWLASTAYTLTKIGDQMQGSVVKPNAYNERIYKCTTAGTSGGTEPTWNTTIGGTTSDGSVTWTTYEAITKQGTVTGLVVGSGFLDTVRTEASGFYKYGTVLWTTGLNAGFESEVKASNANQVDFYLPTPFAVALGDEYHIVRGCDRSEPACKIFENFWNFDGEPHKPLTSALLQYTTR